MLRLGGLDPVTAAGRMNSQVWGLGMAKERGVGSVAGSKKHGRVVPVLGHARLKRGFCKDHRLCVHLLLDGPCARFSLETFVFRVRPEGFQATMAPALMGQPGLSVLQSILCASVSHQAPSEQGPCHLHRLCV